MLRLVIEPRKSKRKVSVYYLLKMELKGSIMENKQNGRDRPEFKNS